LSPAERRRLVGVLGLLASDQDGERAAAGLLATRLLRSAGVTWDQVIPERSGQLGHSKPAPADWRADLVLAQRHVRFLRAWEQNFVSGLATFTAPSRKQKTILHEIADSLRARGRA
jgi:hypothetical protein